MATVTEKNPNGWPILALARCSCMEDWGYTDHETLAKMRAGDIFCTGCGVDIEVLEAVTAP